MRSPVDAMMVDQAALAYKGTAPGTPCLEMVGGPDPVLSRQAGGRVCA
jgi:hypothetical protein